MASAAVKTGKGALVLAPAVAWVGALVAWVEALVVGEAFGLAVGFWVAETQVSGSLISDGRELPFSFLANLSTPPILMV